MYFEAKKVQKMKKFLKKGAVTWGKRLFLVKKGAGKK